jgi:hypothetical protein
VRAVHRNKLFGGNEPIFVGWPALDLDVTWIAPDHIKINTCKDGKAIRDVILKTVKWYSLTIEYSSDGCATASAKWLMKPS